MRENERGIVSVVVTVEMLSREERIRLMPFASTMPAIMIMMMRDLVSIGLVGAIQSG